MHMNARSRSIQINRDRLIAALKTNLEVHITQYQEAVFDYRMKLQADLEKALADLKAGAVPVDDITVTFDSPTSHEAEFRDAIAILEYEERETIEIDGETFKAWVQNQWAWSRNFEIMNASYKTAIIGGAAR